MSQVTDYLKLHGTFLSVVLSGILICFLMFIVDKHYEREKRTKEKDYFKSLTGADAIETFTIGALETYHRMAVTLHSIFVLLGFIAIVGSVFVTTFVSSKGEVNNTMKGLLPAVAFLSTTSLTLISAFNISTKSNNCRKAWRHLHHAYEIYKARGPADLRDLIQARKKAEEILGGVDFQYKQ